MLRDINQTQKGIQCMISFILSLINRQLICDDKSQNSSWLCRLEFHWKGFIGDLSGVMKMFYDFIVVIITRVHAFVKSHQTVH